MLIVNHNYIIPHAQKDNFNLPNVFLTAIQWLLVTYTKYSAFLRAKKTFQGQLQTPQSASVLETLNPIPICVGLLLADIFPSL